MFDREAIIAAVDLPTLADQLLGERKGSPHTPTWSCPNPDHYQTGRTPPVSIFVARWGEQRWHCHGCGNGGTAIDLVMQVRGVDAKEALAVLGRSTGIPELPAGSARPLRNRVERKVPPLDPFAPRPVPELEQYVADCAEMLWHQDGGSIRRWLTEARRLPEDVLKVNRVGVDLGPGRQSRPNGVPRVRRAVVLPVLAQGQACYVQLRTLNADRDFPRYLSCRESLARNPRLGVYRPAQTFGYPFEQRFLIVTEGVVDALSAAAGGYLAAAYLGADLPDRGTAVRLARTSRQIVVAFDPDLAGRAGAQRLVQFLRERHRNPAVMDLNSGDLNSCLVRSAEWPLEIAGRLQHATARVVERPQPGVGLGRG